MIVFFFFKQKTAYEMRISDWSSDVCSSDLSAVSKVVSAPANAGPANQRQANRRRAMATIARSVRPLFFRTDCMLGSLHMETRRIRAQVKGWSDALRGCNGRPAEEIGRASCRERVCQYV